MSQPLVGIIANPASGRDIRRLVAYGTVFDNNEKMAIVRRVLLGLEAVGITQVAYMPEREFGILPRAINGLTGRKQGSTLQAFPLSMPVLATSTDSTRAAQMLASMGAGLVAIGHTGEDAVHRAPRLAVLINGEVIESALVDVVLSSVPFVGSRAIWDLSTVSEVVLSRVAPATIGLSALGGALLDGASKGVKRAGMHIRLGPGGPQLLVALAPGLIEWVAVNEYQRLVMNDVVRFLPGAGTVALDGEREIELSPKSEVEVQLCADGPFVVNVSAALEGAASGGYLH